jgi:HSP20 family protein
MNALTRWNPFRELDEIQGRLGSLIGKSYFQGENGKEAMTLAEWAPSVDITEDEKEYVIKADLPEVKKEDLKVSLENGVLEISGERRFEKEEKGKRYHRIERSYGSFMRSFTMPEKTDPAKVMAEFKDGVLKVRLPKDEKAQPKTVEVKVQ